MFSLADEQKPVVQRLAGKKQQGTAEARRAVVAGKEKTREQIASQIEKLPGSQLFKQYAQTLRLLTGLF